MLMEENKYNSRRILIYPRGDIYIYFLIALTFIAFWRGYFRNLLGASFGFHLHAATATIWMFLLATQISSAHRDDRRLHRILGQSSLGLFPFLLAGMVAVVISLGRETLAGDRLYLIYGAKIDNISILAFSATAIFYFEGLRHRRNACLHARYMIATTLLLCFSIFDRLNGYLPFALFRGLDGFAWCVRFANAQTLIIVFALYWQDPRHGRPFALTGTVIVLQMIAWEIVRPSDKESVLIFWVAHLPLVASLIVAIVAGTVISRLGWRLGSRPYSHP